MENIQLSKIEREEKEQELLKLCGLDTLDKIILVRSDFKSKDVERAEQLVRELNNGKLTHAWYE